MPGGVSSPVRAFKSVGGQPIVFDRVKGAYIWDVDGNQYIDYVGTWGACHLRPRPSRSAEGAVRSAGKGNQFLAHPAISKMCWPKW